MRQRYIQERKLQKNIPDEHRCKNLNKILATLIQKHKDGAPQSSSVFQGMQVLFNILKLKKLNLSYQ